MLTLSDIVSMISSTALEMLKMLMFLMKFLESQFRMVQSKISWTKKSMNLVAEAIFLPQLKISLQIYPSSSAMLMSLISLIISLKRAKKYIMDATWPTSEFNGFLSSCETAALIRVKNDFSALTSLYNILSETSIIYNRVLVLDFLPEI